MGLISRVSSRTYRDDVMLNRVLQYSVRGMRHFGRNRERPNKRPQTHALVSKGHVPNYMRAAVWLSFYLGMNGMLHTIHSGTNRKYAKIRRDADSYNMATGCPIREQYKNWKSRFFTSSTTND